MMPSHPDHSSKMPDGRPLDEQPKWRQDFPVDTELDEYAARRDFVKFLVLISGAFVVGQAWVGVQNILRKMKGKPPMKAIAAVNELPIGQSISFDYPSAHDPCILMRTRTGALVAYSQSCTHLACALLPDMDNEQMVCPCHQGFFEMASGKPTSGPPRRPLPRILLETRGDKIYATDVELRT